MFNKEDYFLIGTLVKTRGVSGELIINPGNLNLKDIEEMESVFIEFDGLLVPFFIDHITSKGSTSVSVKFDSIDTEDQAAEYINCKVYSTSLHKMEEEPLLDQAKSLKGFQVVDQKFGNLGIIDEFLDVSNNPLFKIKKGTREILLPVNEEFIIDIDEHKRIITVQTPEGLVDLYSNQ